jgi:hypothetical protein
MINLVKKNIMRSVWTLAALLGAAPLMAQDRDVERLKQQHDRTLKQLDEKYKAERDRIVKEFEAKMRGLTERRAPPERKTERTPAEPGFARITCILEDLSKRVAALEQRLSRLEQALRKGPSKEPEPPKRRKPSSPDGGR